MLNFQCNISDCCNGLSLWEHITRQVLSLIHHPSSSFYWASVANAPNVLQPYWLIVLPLDVPALTPSLLLWGPSGQRWRCLWTFLFSNVPTFATSHLQEILAAKGRTTWARNSWWILPENARLPPNIQGSFTCLKSTTWDRRLYFPSKGRHAEDFFHPEKSNGFGRVWTHKLVYQRQHATSRPLKPLYTILGLNMVHCKAIQYSVRILNQITIQSKVLLDKPISPHPVEIFPFMEPDGSSMCSQQPMTYLYPEPHESTPQLPSLFPSILVSYYIWIF